MEPVCATNFEPHGLINIALISTLSINSYNLHFVTTAGLRVGIVFRGLAFDVLEACIEPEARGKYIAGYRKESQIDSDCTQNQSVLFCCKD